MSGADADGPSPPRRRLPRWAVVGVAVFAAILGFFFGVSLAGGAEAAAGAAPMGAGLASLP